MPSPVPWRARPLALATLCLALGTVACSGPAATSPGATGRASQTPSSPGASMVPTTGASPGASGTAACPAVPVPSGTPEGWGQPATAPSVIPNLITTPVVCGPNRILFSFVNEDLVPVAAPDRSASIAIYELGTDPSEPLATAPGEFVWAIQDQVGIYVANLSFPASGRYGAEFVTAAAGGPSETIRMTFDVQPDSSVVKVGDRAPASRTPTLSDVGGQVSHISTDQNPDPALYETSVDQALKDRDPFVLVFATPKFCQSAQCGPTLDRLKPFVERYPTVTFINVEPYKLKLEGDSLEPDVGPGGLQPVDASVEWGLINEPIVFVVDRQGIVRDAFELIFSDSELTAAIDEVK